MNNRIYIIVLIFLTSLFSCRPEKIENIDISGKWWSYNISETEYCEYDIDKDSLGRFSHYDGNSPPMVYRVEKDTLYYRDFKFKLDVISENQFTIALQNRTDTLTRLPDSINTFHTITYKDDSIFDTFYSQYTNRAHDCWIKYGYVTREELENSILKEGEIDEKIITENNK